MVPSTLSSMNRIDWLPVNLTAKVVIELCGLSNSVKDDVKEESSPLRIYHVLNPQATSWEEILPAVTSGLGPDVSVVDWSVWLKALEESEQKEDVDSNPGVKLLDFYRASDKAGSMGLNLPVLETEETRAASETLREMGPVRQEWMAEWMKQWNF